MYTIRVLSPKTTAGQDSTVRDGSPARTKVSPKLSNTPEPVERHSREDTTGVRDTRDSGARSGWPLAIVASALAGYAPLEATYQLSLHTTTLARAISRVLYGNPDALDLSEMLLLIVPRVAAPLSLLIAVALGGWLLIRYYGDRVKTYALLVGVPAPAFTLVYWQVLHPGFRWWEVPVYALMGLGGAFLAMSTGRRTIARHRELDKVASAIAGARSPDQITGAIHDHMVSDRLATVSLWRPCENDPSTYELLDRYPHRSALSGIAWEPRDSSLLAQSRYTWLDNQRMESLPDTAYLSDDLTPDVRVSQTALALRLNSPDGRFIGLLVLTFSKRVRKQPLSRTVVRYLTIAAQVALALENLRLVERVMEDEHNRIADDVHETPIQRLKTIHMLLESAERRVDKIEQYDDELDGLAKDIARSKRNAEDGMRETRLLIWRNRLHELEQYPIADAVQVMLSDWEQLIGISTVFNVLGEPRPTGSQQRRSTLRILSEALNNVATHARATTVAVAVAYQPSLLRLTITDDGCGIPERLTDEEILSQHITTISRARGLTIMAENTRRSHGTLSVAPGPGGGTQIIAIVPTAGTRPEEDLQSH